MQKQSSENRSSNPSRIPPHNLEAEQAVLASALIDPHVIDELMGQLTEDDFYQSAHRVIYNSLVSLHIAGKPLDLVTLAARLSDEDALDKAGGLDYVAELVNIIPNSANVMGYAHILREKSLMRRLISVGGEVSELGFDITGEVTDLIDAAQQKVYEIGEGTKKDSAEHIHEVLLRNNARLTELYNMDERDKNVSGVTSGIDDLDAMTNGFQKSDLIIVAGRPGMGKTSFGLNILLNAANDGKTCVFFSLEMSSEQLVNRLISCEAKIVSSKLRTGDLTLEEMSKYGNFISKLEKLNIYLDDTPQITINQIRSRCRQLKARAHGKLDMVFVDYLQIMGFNKNLQVREQQISEISRSLKSIAKEFGIPVMAFAQVNRNVEARSDNRPMMSDLRESGAIEQDADIIMFLYRDEMYKETTPFKNVAEIIIAKHRNGETGTVFVSFDAEYTHFNGRKIDKPQLALLWKEHKKPARGAKKHSENQDG